MSETTGAALAERLPTNYDGQSDREKSDILVAQAAQMVIKGDKNNNGAVWGTIGHKVALESEDRVL